MDFCKLEVIKSTWRNIKDNKIQNKFFVVENFGILDHLKFTIIDIFLKYTYERTLKFIDFYYYKYFMMFYYFLS